MGKLKVLSGRQVRAILEANGFTFARQKGSYMILVLLQDETSITVSVPDHKEVAVGTLSNIINTWGLSRSLFEV